MLATRVAPLLMLAGFIGGCAAPLPHEDEARRMTGGDPRSGVERIRHYGCISCHDIPGLDATTSGLGPPLAGIGGRGTLAGQLQNTPENMMRWIRQPHSISPTTAMPNLDVSEHDSRDIAAYLYTLK